MQDIFMMLLLFRWVSRWNLKIYYNFSKAFSSEKRVLTFIGFYPAKKSWLNYFIAIFSQSNSAIWYYYSTTYIVENASQIMKIAEAGVIYLTWSLFYLKLTGFLLNRKNFTMAESYLKNDILKISSKPETKILDNYINFILKLGYWYYVSFFITFVMFTVFPLTTHGRVLLAGEYPFKVEDYFVLIYLSQLITSSFGTSFTCCLDLFFVKLASVVTALFEVLCYRIERVKPDEDTDNETIMENLRNCVIFYNELLRLSSTVEQCFGIGIFFQFLGSGIIICFTGFRIILGNIPMTSIEFVFLVFYLACMLWQVSLYCWFGHLLMEKSNGITAACYNVPWNNIDVKAQKMLITIMERAKKPVILKAGGFFLMNLDTLMTILKTSYSYFTLLQTLYKH